MRAIVKYVALAAALAVSVIALDAYKLNGPKWAVKQVPYYINPVNNDVSESAAIAAIKEGAMAWSAQTHADFSFYYMGRTSGSSALNNGKNEVFFRPEADGSVIARTYWWYNSRNELIDADIIFYDGGWQFFTGTSGCSSGVYIEDIAAHEFGHALGLGHSSYSAATMYGSARKCATDKRVLHADDIAGVEALYPPTTANSSPSVSISSPSNNASFTEGTAVQFSGSASDPEDGDLSAQLAWMSSLDGHIGTGASFTRVLTAGSHTITATVYDSHGALGSKSVSVTINAESTNTAPGVTITAPSNKSTVSEGTAISFSGSATDKEDGTLTSKLVWTSSLDGHIGTGGSFNKVLSVGTHTIEAAVTDSGGLSGSAKVSVTVAASTAESSGILLSATGYKIKGSQYADLKWAGATSTKVEIYRNNVRIAVTANDGAYVDGTTKKGGGSATYMVCEAGTSTCSNAVTVTF
jgi:chitodextrinase